MQVEFVANEIRNNFTKILTEESLKDLISKEWPRQTYQIIYISRKGIQRSEENTARLIIAEHDKLKSDTNLSVMANTHPALKKLKNPPYRMEKLLL